MRTSTAPYKTRQAVWRNFILFRGSKNLFIIIIFFYFIILTMHILLNQQISFHLTFVFFKSQGCFLKNIHHGSG